jgi:uncharacterized membrane protein YoaK (UPF0700 family)
MFFVALHAVSDIGITGLLGAKLPTYAFEHDQGLSYALYLMTNALDSVGDVFCSLTALAAGLLAMRSDAAALAWTLVIVAGILFFLQASASAASSPRSGSYSTSSRSRFS